MLSGPVGVGPAHTQDVSRLGLLHVISLEEEEFYKLWPCSTSALSLTQMLCEFVTACHRFLIMTCNRCAIHYIAGYNKHVQQSASSCSLLYCSNWWQALPSLVRSLVVVSCGAKSAKEVLVCSKRRPAVDAEGVESDPELNKLNCAVI